ncbi:hypothetical protein D3C78_614250 [compost metagenome]
MATTSRKIRVRPTSRASSAISLGVFWRLAPSTSAIILSSVLSPGLLVTRTQISSDTTVVLPVTPLRSVPDSRMTGADSPVMAASLTEAIPAMTSPSAGIISPLRTSTRSPFCRLVAATHSPWPSFGSLTLRAWSWLMPAFRLSARALPRPSARVSAKLANHRVSHNQAVSCQARLGVTPDRG